MLYETKFLVSLGATLVLEVPVAFILVKWVFRLKQLKGSEVLLWSMLASVLTLPYLWFILPPYVDKSNYLLIGEVLVFLLEMFLYFVGLKLKLWQAFVVSLSANVISYFVGLSIVRAIFS